MNKETPKKPPEGKQAHVEAAKPNPFAIFLAKCSIVAQKELPVVLCGLAGLAGIAALVAIKYISVEFMLILTFLTIAKTSFNAGVVWQRLRCGKGRA